MKLFSIFCLLILGHNCQAQPADFVFYNGKIFTSDKKKLYVEALAVSKNIIAATGTNKEILTLAGPATKRINLEGKTVVPGFNDAHMHHVPLYIGRYISFSPDGTGSPARSVLEDSIIRVARTLPKGTWIHASLGPETIMDTSLNRFSLDELAPDHPIHLWSYWGHVGVFNSAALKTLQLLNDPPEIKAGFYGRVTTNNELDGRIYDNTQYLSPVLETLTDKEAFARSLKTLAEEALQYGVTSLQNMCTFASPDTYAEMWQKVGLPIRFRAIAWADMDRNGKLLIPPVKKPKSPPGLPLMTISGTKWMIEGTPLEKHAYYSAGYNEPPGWSGIAYHTTSELKQMLTDAATRSDQPMFHISGDSMINVLLQAMNGLPLSVAKNMRVRIEHGDGISKKLLRELVAKGIVVVVNPVHPSQDTSIHFLKDYADKKFNLVKSLVAAGIPTAIGSDGPLNPFLNIMLAMIRPVENLSCEEAVIAYTSTAAYAEFAEKQKGTLEKGKLADLVVLSQDIFTIPPPQLMATKVFLTMVDGTVGYQIPGFQ